MEKTANITIIGAGVSGLLAAKTLEEKGYSPTVLEATETVGGRVKTDFINSVPLDRGFQVLLTAYPMVQKHLNLEALNLNYFKPGALLFSNGKRERIGDPLRDFSALWPTLVAKAGTFKDKWKIFKLSLQLKRSSLDDIFESKETITLAFLQDYGFTDSIINNFFKPFFTGIFLEEELRTSSRMFQFVFKMFGEGYAAVPQNGIGAVAEQLKNSLKQTTFQFNTKVNFSATGKIATEKGETITTDAVLCSTPLQSEVAWKSCHNFYFETSEWAFEPGIIGLLTVPETYANNINYLFQTKTPILSVTVVKESTHTVNDLEQLVRKELKLHCAIETGRLVKHYHIKKALPDLENIRQDFTQKGDSSNSIFIGDYTLNGSLNAAMQSGEAGARVVINQL
ncbi:FAD-dependent oxidoreductase [Croceivirga radicis]|uniref:FAD-dependent oxidoreductase n=1 Tax=Croceivirga radicis TaxID=1929488 RepID=UPI000255B86C|nr:FAD-dependent oxidoreductase [Croceivirga radicis]